MRIIKVEIQGFRGFVDNAIFELNDSDIVLIYGPNGHGKTSFFDAIEWGLTGKLHRYDTSTDERNRTKFLGNQLTGKAPVVKIFLREEEKEIVVIRTGKQDTGNSTDYGKFDLELFENGKKYEGGISPQERLAEILINKEWRHKVTEDKLNSMFNLTHYLGQEKMLHFINETKDKERYDALSTVLGTDYFQFYESRFKSAKELLKKDIEHNDQEKSKLIAQQQFLNKEIGSLEVDLSGQAINFSEIKKSIDILKEIFNVELDENTSIEDTIKVVNEINQDLLEKSNHIYTRKNDLEYINHLVDSYYTEYNDNFESDLEVYENIKELNFKIEEVNRILNKVKLVEGEIEKLKYLNNDYREINLLSAQKRRENENSQNLFNKLVKEFETFRVNKSLSPIVQTIENEFKDLKLQKKVEICIKEINELQQVSAQLKLNIKHKRDEIESYEDRINNVTNLNNKLEKLLTVTNDYIEENRNISYCPICGTNNISYEDILKQITDMKSNEFLNTYKLIQTKNNLTQEFEGLKKKLKTTEDTLLEKIKEFNDFLEEFNGYLKIEENELKTLERNQYNLQNNIRSLESNLQDIEENLLKYNLTLERGSLFVESELSELLINLETSRINFKNKIHIENGETVEDAINFLKSKLTELDYKKKEFMLLLNKYNKNYQINI
ncbi:AAA family ATPase [Bacillus cereus]|uniref:AAA family ATPase n=1 Tax=Bacillus cereus TaxID=1396 RepID=UPI00366E37B6